MEIIANKAFFFDNTLDRLSLEINTKSEDKNNDWKDKKLSSSIIIGQKFLSWIDFGTIIKAGNKLIKIFREETLISKQRQSFYKIFTMLTYH